MGVILMKKTKNRLIAILFLFLLCSSSFIFNNHLENYDSKNIIQDISSPKLSNPGKTLLHSYDFEDEIIGLDPTYESFTIDESSGDVYIDDLSDGQQKHMVLNKVGTTGRVWVRDYFSRSGETYIAGEYHLKVYHDTSGFGINLNSANNEYILAMVWWNGEIRDDVGGTLLATYAYNQWLDVVIYFNLSLGWMFDLEGVRYGAGYSFSFFGAFTANAEHIWITSFVSGGGDGYLRVDDIAFYYDESRSSIHTDDTGNGADMIMIIPSIAISIIMIFTVILIVKKKLKGRGIVSDKDIEILPSTDRIIKQEERVELLYCPFCNVKLEPNISICSYCGSVIEDYLNDSKKSSTK